MSLTTDTVKTAVAVKRAVAGLAAAMAVFAAIAIGSTAQAAPAGPTAASQAAASTDVAPEPTSSVEPFISQRRCNSAELPRQIWLTTNGPTRCYGGVVGGLPLGNLYVEWISTGDYTVSIVCSGTTLRFNPGTDYPIRNICTRLNILPGG